MHTCSFGHAILNPTVGNTDRPSIVSPLRGHLPQSEIMTWLHDHSLKTNFLPRRVSSHYDARIPAQWYATVPFPCSLPYSLLDSTPSHQHHLHRLVYTSLPADIHAIETTQDSAKKIIKYEIVLPQPKLKAIQYTLVKPHRLTHDADGGDRSTLTGLGRSESVPDTTISTLPEAEKAELHYRCWSGFENVINMMMPDR